MFKTKTIPNCAICKWYNRGTFTAVMIGASVCGAQGNKSASIVYNNRLCRILFEKNQEVNNDN